MDQQYSRRGWRPLFVAGLVAPMLAFGCQSSTTVTSSEASVAVEMLSVAPFDSDDPGQVMFVDLDRAFETAGVDGASLCSANDAIGYERALADVTRGRTTNPNARWFFEVEASWGRLPESFGSGLCEMNAIMHVQSAERGALLWHTDELAEVTLELAAQDDVWLDDLVRSQVGEFDVLDWGSEADAGPRDSVRTVGRGGQLTGRDDIVIRTELSDAMNRVTDPNTLRMIDRPHVRSVVEALEAEGTYTFALFDTPWFGPEARLLSPEDLAEIQESGELPGTGFEGLAPWTHLGVGGAVASDGSDVGVIVLAHASDAVAATNADRLSTLIQEGTAFDRLIDMRAIDNIVIATVSSDDVVPFIQLGALIGQRELFAIGS